MLEVTQATQPIALPDMTWDERRDLGLHRLLRALPVAAVSRIGASLGHLLGRRAYPGAAARVEAALRHLRPDLARDPRRLEDAQRLLWANVGRVYAEFCVLDRIVSEGRVEVRRAREVDSVLADGRPVIMAYVHLGNWEAAGMHVSRRYPDRCCALANPAPANRVQARIMDNQRAHFSGKVITIDSMVWRHALEHLRQPGGVLHIAVDENNEEGVSMPSFGRPPDMRGNLAKIVRIAARTGAVILPCYCERLPGARFYVHFLEPVAYAQRQDVSAEETLQRMQGLDALYAPIVLRLIDQWFGLLELRP